MNATFQAGEREQLPQLTKKDSISLDDIVAMLIRVFVDASPHIPEHRQLPLFTHLICTLGSTQFLHTAVILLLEKHVIHSQATPGENQVSFSMSVVLCKCNAHEEQGCTERVHNHKSRHRS